MHRDVGRACAGRKIAHPHVVPRVIDVKRLDRLRVLAQPRGDGVKAEQGSRRGHAEAALYVKTMRRSAGGEF